MKQERSKKEEKKEEIEPTFSNFLPIKSPIKSRELCATLSQWPDALTYHIHTDTKPYLGSKLKNNVELMILYLKN